MTKKITKAVIPVAGFGTRFLPATIAQPKEMLTVVDKPVIQYIVEEMMASGIREIIFVTGRGKRAIEDHFDFSWELEHLLKIKGKEHLLEEVEKISNLVNFVYVRQNKPLGTGHALLCAKEIIGNEPFAFSYGDDVITGSTPAVAQMIEGYNKYQKMIVGTRRVEKENVSSYGIVDPVNGSEGKFFAIKNIVEKPKINEAPSNVAMYGRYIFTPDIFKEIENTKPGMGGEIWLTDAAAKLVRKKSGYACLLDGEFYDCGNKLEYLKANVYFALKHPDLSEPFRKYLSDLKI